MEGKLSEINADLIIIIMSFRESVAEEIGGEAADALIEDAVRLSKLTTEEAEKEIAREKERVKEDIKKIIEGLGKNTEQNKENGNAENRN